ncbi:unnamed protein product [Lathyrus oleraceus]
MAFLKNDNQTSFGSKRPRNNVIRKDGDWLCTTCGNLNFAFRIACNRKCCGAPKSSGPPTPKSSGSPTVKSFVAPIRILATETVSPYNGGVATPPPPPHGIPINFGSIPSFISYGSNGTMAPRSFGPKTSVQAGSSIPSGSFGAKPFIPSESFGGLTIKDSEIHNDSEFYKKSESRQNSKFRKNSKSHKDSEFSKDSGSQKVRIKGPKVILEGDWVCPRCENVNFAFRTKCNIKNCRVPKPESYVTPSFS